MSAVSRVHLVALIDTELRTAAHALRRVYTMDKADGDAFGAAVNDALAASYTALYHLSLPDADTCGIVVVAVPVPRVTLVKRGGRAAASAEGGEK